MTETVRDYPTRQEIVDLSPCPKCGVGKGVRCRRKRNSQTPRKASHTARLKAAQAALKKTMAGIRQKAHDDFFAAVASGEIPRRAVDEIVGARSEKGGWTRQTLAEWGVPWPPPSGWKRALQSD